MNILTYLNGITKYGCGPIPLMASPLPAVVALPINPNMALDQPHPHTTYNRDRKAMEKKRDVWGIHVGVVFIVIMASIGCSPGEEVASAVFVFGDSLADVGNNNYLQLSLAKADFQHNGIDFPTGKPTGRFSNGKNAADFLGTYYLYCILYYIY